MRKTLTNIALAGALTLGAAGCLDRPREEPISETKEKLKLKGTVVDVINVDLSRDTVITGLRVNLEVKEFWNVSLDPEYLDSLPYWIELKSGFNIPHLQSGDGIYFELTDGFRKTRNGIDYYGYLYPLYSINSLLAEGRLLSYFPKKTQTDAIK